MYIYMYQCFEGLYMCTNALRGNQNNSEIPPIADRKEYIS